MRFPMAWKIGLLATVPVLLTALFVGLMVYSAAIDKLIEHEEIDLRDEARLQAERVSSQLAMLREDALRMATLPALRRVVRAKQAGDTDPVTGKSAFELRQDLEHAFEQVCSDEVGNAKPYFQVRLIGVENDGREIARIEKLATGTADRDGFVASKLQSKAGRPYFQAMLRHALDDRRSAHDRVFLSEINLNREHGEVESNRPTLRAGVPVHDNQDQLFGFVVINLDLTQIAQELVGSPRHLVYLTNREGDLLVHPDERKTFVWDDPQKREQFAGKRYRIQEQPAFAALKDFYNPEYSDPRIPRVSGKLCYELELRGSKLGERETPFLPAADAFASSEGDVAFALTVFKVLDEAGRERLETKLKAARQDHGIRAPTRITARKNASISISAPTVAGLQELLTDLESDPELAVAIEVDPITPAREFAAHFYRIYFDPLDPQRHLGFVMAFSYDEMDAELAPTRTLIAGGVVLLSALVVIVALVFSQFVTRRLTRITRAARELADDNFNVDLPLGSRDEIGDLARGFEAMVADIQEKSADVRDREARLRMIFDTAADGIVTIDHVGCIRRLNASAERMFDVTEDELRGASFAGLLGPEFRPALVDVLASLESSEGTWAGEGCLEMTGLRNDRPFPLELSVSSVRVGDHRIVILIIRDVTERKRAEEQIREANERLEDRVRERTHDLELANQALAKARDRAEAASKAKSTFLANMNHELRTPLNAIIGYSEMLSEDFDAAGDAAVVEDLERVRQAGKHLLSLINDVLDLAKIEAGKLDLVPEDIEAAALVRDLANLMQFAADKNGNLLEVVVDERLGVMHHDRTRIRQILSNLLGNACKFTHDGKITLTASRLVLAGEEQVIFRVADTGIGMTPEHVARIFEPFEQADASISRRFGGTGLGMAICRRLSALMGGEIEVDSVEGEGTTVTVRLPLRQPGPPASADEPLPTEPAPSAVAGRPSEADSGGEPRVLVIDDDHDVLDLMERYLTRAGFRVFKASRGVEGIRIARELQPDVITLDVALPGMDGWSVLSALKDDPQTADIPIVMVSIMEQQQRGLALGATSYLTKPIDWDLLVRVLRQQAGRGEPAEVLVVEDDEDLRKVTCRVLERDGWSVVEASDGRGALERLGRRVPDLILLDLVLPEMNGLQFLAELRSNARWRDVPVVVVTNLRPLVDLSPGDRERLTRQASNVILKGAYERDELLAEIERSIVHSLGNRTASTAKETSCA